MPLGVRKLFLYLLKHGFLFPALARSFHSAEEQGTIPKGTRPSLDLPKPIHNKPTSADTILPLACDLTPFYLDEILVQESLANTNRRELVGPFQRSHHNQEYYTLMTCNPQDKSTVIIYQFLKSQW